MSPSPRRPTTARRLFSWVGCQPALAALLLVCGAAALRYETFSTVENLRNILRQNSMAALLALGMMFTMLSGGIDLSVGALLAVSAVLAASFSAAGSAVAIIGALAATTVLGACNGWLVTRARIQPFIATLAMNMAARGALLSATGEESVGLTRDALTLTWLGRGWVGPVPAPVLVALVGYLFAGALLGHTRFGRHVYAVGDNAEAARLLGLNVDGVRILVYALSGLLAGVAGVILVGRVGVAQPTVGLGWELAAITAVILGSTTDAGGQGGPLPTLIGVLLFAVLFNIFNLEGTLSSHWQWVLQGLFLLLVVVIQSRLGTHRP